MIIELIMQNCSVYQSAFLSGFGTVWTGQYGQYGISGRESQTSLFVIHPVAGANERWVYLQATSIYKKMK